MTPTTQYRLLKISHATLKLGGQPGCVTMPPPAAKASATDALVSQHRFLPSRKQLISWQGLVVSFAVGVTVGWVVLLVYGLGKLITLH